MPASQQQVVERAEALLSTHSGKTLPMAQLCRVVGVSERSLRNAFYAVRGVSPTRHALRTRLEEVHRALKDADASRSVTTIATDYGFFELGRFAGQYKAVFGETPSETLRGGRGDELGAAS